MNILGITGLGISPAACLIQDGKLIAMAEEERFNRLKGSFGFLPEKATRFCLDYKKLNLEDIDYIVFPWDVYKYRLYMPLFFLYSYLIRSDKSSNESFTMTLKELLKYQPGKVKSEIRFMLRNAGIKGRVPQIEFIPHHIAHAASTFYCSGFDSADILVMDGSGEDKCTTIFKGNGLEIKEKKSFRIPDSLGWFYQSVAEFLGFLPNRDEGKIMALAAYGEYNQEIYSKFKRVISFNDKGSYSYDANFSFLGKHVHGNVYSEKMVGLFNNTRSCRDPIQQIHKNIAYAAQDILERIAISIVKSMSYCPTYTENLCIAGGVGLNCKMNGAIARELHLEQLFIPPFSNDAGTALGAALYFSKEKGYNPKFKLEHASWGPEFPNNQIKQLLDKYNVKHKECDRIEKEVAKLLSQDKVIGWFQGRMEIGPRALGSRSILANPKKEWMKDYINSEIKNRESWRPFAPSILYESKDKYLVKPKNDSPFMALTFTARDEAKDAIPAVVHIDNTTRPHFVKKEVNLKYWELIKEFADISGVPAIVNTSFNVDGEPIVCTPEHALKTFFASKLDYLAMGNFILYK